MPRTSNSEQRQPRSDLKVQHKKNKLASRTENSSLVVEDTSDASMEAFWVQIDHHYSNFNSDDRDFVRELLIDNRTDALAILQDNHPTHCKSEFIIESKETMNFKSIGSRILQPSFHRVPPPLQTLTADCTSLVVENMIKRGGVDDSMSRTLTEIVRGPYSRFSKKRMTDMGRDDECKDETIFDTTSEDYESTAKVPFLSFNKSAIESISEMANPLSFAGLQNSLDLRFDCPSHSVDNLTRTASFGKLGKRGRHYAELWSEEDFIIAKGLSESIEAVHDWQTMFRDYSEDHDGLYRDSLHSFLADKKNKNPKKNSKRPKKMPIFVSRATVSHLPPPVPVASHHPACWGLQRTSLHDATVKDVMYRELESPSLNPSTYFDDHCQSTALLSCKSSDISAAPTAAAAAPPAAGGGSGVDISSTSSSGCSCSSSSIYERVHPASQSTTIVYPPGKKWTTAGGGHHEDEEMDDLNLAAECDFRKLLLTDLDIFAHLARIERGIAHSARIAQLRARRIRLQSCLENLFQANDPQNSRRFTYSLKPVKGETTQAKSLLGRQVNESLPAGRHSNPDHFMEPADVEKVDCGLAPSSTPQLLVEPISDPSTYSLTDAWTGPVLNPSQLASSSADFTCNEIHRIYQPGVDSSLVKAEEEISQGLQGGKLKESLTLAGKPRSQPKNASVFEATVAALPLTGQSRYGTRCSSGSLKRHYSTIKQGSVKPGPTLAQPPLPASIEAHEASLPLPPAPLSHDMLGPCLTEHITHGSFVKSLQRGEKVEARLQGCWRAAVVKRLQLSGGTHLTYVKVAMLNSFPGDTTWLCVADNNLAPRGTHLKKPHSWATQWPGASSIGEDTAKSQPPAPLP